MNILITTGIYPPDVGGPAKFVPLISKHLSNENEVRIITLSEDSKLNQDEKNKVYVKMTLTSPNCPVAESLPNDVKNSIEEIKEVKEVDLNLVWDPPWDKSMMSEAAKLELNL